MGESDRSPGPCVGEAIASTLFANPPTGPPELLRNFFRREQNRQSGGAIICGHAIPLWSVCGAVVSIRVVSGGHGCAGRIHVLGSSPGRAHACPARAMRAAGCGGSTEETEERKKSVDSVCDLRFWWVDFFRGGYGRTTEEVGCGDFFRTSSVRGAEELAGLSVLVRGVRLGVVPFFRLFRRTGGPGGGG